MTDTPSSAVLVVLTGRETGRSFSISDVATVGRSDENDIVVVDPSISRRHVKLQRLQDGFLVTDLGSRSKVTYRGRTVTECKVSLGEEFVLGAVRVKLLPVEEETESIEHPMAVLPTAVPVVVAEGTETQKLFEEAAAGGSRKGLAAVGIVIATAVAAYLLVPYFTVGPPEMVLDIILNEGEEKALGVWNPAARVMRQQGLSVKDPRIADVTVDTPDGFIIKAVGKSAGITSATGVNRAGGTTTVTIVVRSSADELWELTSKPDAEKRKAALYHIGLAADIRTHNPYQSMKEYALAARILEQMQPRPPEYSRAVLKETELRKEIDAQIAEFISAYQLAKRAKRYDSAGAELRKILDLVTDESDYRRQKASLYLRLMRRLLERQG